MVSIFSFQTFNFLEMNTFIFSNFMSQSFLLNFADAIVNSEHIYHIIAISDHLPQLQKGTHGIFHQLKLNMHTAVFYQFMLKKKNIGTNFKIKINLVFNAIEMMQWSGTHTDFVLKVSFSFFLLLNIVILIYWEFKISTGQFLFLNLFNNLNKEFYLSFSSRYHFLIQKRIFSLIVVFGMMVFL